MFGFFFFYLKFNKIFPIQYLNIKEIIIKTLMSVKRNYTLLSRGGGGGTSICMHIGYVPQTRPPFSAMNFRSGAYHFHKLPKNPFRSITILFFGGFCRSGDHNFQNFYNFTRSSPPTAAAQRIRQRRGLAAVPEIRWASVRQRRGLAAVPEIRTFKRSAAPRVSGRSGDSHFQVFGSAAG